MSLGTIGKEVGERKDLLAVPREKNKTRGTLETFLMLESWAMKFTRVHYTLPV